MPTIAECGTWYATAVSLRHVLELTRAKTSHIPAICAECRPGMRDMCQGPTYCAIIASHTKFKPKFTLLSFHKNFHSLRQIFKKLRAAAQISNELI